VFAFITNFWFARIQANKAVIMNGMCDFSSIMEWHHHFCMPVIEKGQKLILCSVTPPHQQQCLFQLQEQLQTEQLHIVFAGHESNGVDWQPCWMLGWLSRRGFGPVVRCE